MRRDPGQESTLRSATPKYRPKSRGRDSPRRAETRSCEDREYRTRKSDPWGSIESARDEVCTGCADCTVALSGRWADHEDHPVEDHPCPYWRNLRLSRRRVDPDAERDTGLNGAVQIPGAAGGSWFDAMVQEDEARRGRAAEAIRQRELARIWDVIAK